jgi:hypothetical protein
MSTTTPWQVDFNMPANGRVGKAEVILRTADRSQVLATDKANLMSLKDRKRLAKNIAEIVKEEPGAVLKKLEADWNKAFQQDEQRRKAEAEAARAAAQSSSILEDVDVRAERLLRDMPRDVVKEATDFLNEPELWSLVVKDVQTYGVAGEQQLCLGLYLTGTSRLLRRPLAALVRGPTTSGKSWLVEQVAEFIPWKGS